MKSAIIVREKERVCAFPQTYQSEYDRSTDLDTHHCHDGAGVKSTVKLKHF